MKKKLLALALALLACCSLFAQSITGETSPCPNTEYTYQITLPSNQGHPFISSTVRRFQVVSETQTQSGSNITHKYLLKWDNYYEVVGGSPVQQTFQLTNGMDFTVKYELKVTIKGLSNVQFSTVPSPSCAYRGAITVRVDPVANADRYVWTNNAGWIGSNNSSTNVFTVNNENPASVTVVAYNDACSTASPVVSKTNSTTISRASVTAAPAFTATSPTVLCPGTPATAGVTVTEGSPIRYEWYTSPAGYININGEPGHNSPQTVYNSQTIPNVPLTYTDPGTGGKAVLLYSRAVYSENCKSEFSYYQINTGMPAVHMFSANTQTLGLVYGDSFGGCPIEVLQVHPETNYSASNILEHQWEIVSNGGNSIGTLTGGTLRIRMSSQLNIETELRYRFRTACGWSNWLNFYVFTWECNAAKAAGKASTSKTSVPAIITGFSVSPNPASNEISVSLPAAQTDDLVLNITDIKGTSLIRRKQAATTRFTVDISSLHAGQYIIQVRSGSNSYSKQFIVVK